MPSRPGDPQPVTVFRTSSATDAHLIQSELQHVGIRCAVHGDQLSDALSIYGSAVSKIEIMVDATQVGEAQDVIAGLKLSRGKSRPDRWGLFDNPDWRCAECFEVNGAAFDECWSCQQPRTSDAERVYIDETDRSSIVEDVQGHQPSVDDASPYRPPTRQTKVVHQEEADEELGERAVRAAVLGLAFPIPLSIVAVRLSLKSLIRVGVNRNAVIAGFLALPLSLVAIGMLMLAAAALIRSFG